MCVVFVDSVGFFAGEGWLFLSFLRSPSFGRAFSFLSLSPSPSFGAGEVLVSIVTSDAQGEGGVVLMGSFYLSFSQLAYNLIIGRILGSFFAQRMCCYVPLLLGGHIVCGLSSIPIVLFLWENLGGVVG